MHALVDRIGALLSLRGRYRVLHLTMLAFFLSFVVWFDFAPFAKAVGRDLGLSKGQLTTLALCNLALTVPARIFIGMLLDRFGPRRVYAGLLVFAAVPNTLFAMSSSFTLLVVSRLLVGIVGAGFVVGIRMIAEWFRSDEIGTAEGYYGGWGNFGSAAAALSLPTLATLLADGQSAWRWGVGATGAVCAGYGLVYLFAVRDTPADVAYQRPVRQGALEVTRRGSVTGLLLLNLPPVAVLGLVAYRIEDAGVISATGFWVVVVLLVALYAVKAWRVLVVNWPVRSGGRPTAEPYPFRSVVLLSLAYSVTFGTELAIVSLLPTYFSDTFGLHVTAAGVAGSAFAFTNLATRPAGGVASDLSPSRRWTLIGLLLGITATFAVMTQMSSAWPLWLGVLVVMLASVFVQGGNGAVFAMVPLVTRRSGGQVAGIAGAYGNVGGLVLTSILAFTGENTTAVFLTIATAALVVVGLCRWLPESPREPVAVPERPVRVAVPADAVA